MSHCENEAILTVLDSLITIHLFVSAFSNGEEMKKTWRLNHDVHGACEHNSVSPEERPSNEETITFLKLINETNRSDFQMVFPLFEV